MAKKKKKELHEHRSFTAPSTVTRIELALLYADNA
jgi:hypothetical protein